MSKPCYFNVSGEGLPKFREAMKLCMTLGDYDNYGTERVRDVIGFVFLRRDDPPKVGSYVQTCKVAADEKAQPRDYLALVDFLHTPEYRDKELQMLPFPMSRESAIEYAWAYASIRDMAGRQPDTDGDNHLGWEVRNAQSLGVWSGPYVACVRPTWITYGK